MQILPAVGARPVNPVMAHESVFVGGRIALSELRKDLRFVEEVVRRFKVKVAEILNICRIFRSPTVLLLFFPSSVLSSIKRWLRRRLK